MLKVALLFVEILNSKFLLFQCCCRVCALAFHVHQINTHDDGEYFEQIPNGFLNLFMAFDCPHHLELGDIVRGTRESVKSFYSESTMIR